jgi:hypothetical protein
MAYLDIRRKDDEGNNSNPMSGNARVQ